MNSIIKNEKAQAGVGTLIIFIAMVLVAAVAAAVLIQTSGVMQSKSTTTTKEAAAAIGENINIESVDGREDDTNLTAVNVTVRIAAGGSAVDISKLMLKVGSQNYNYSTTGSEPNTFRVYVLRGTTLGGSINSYTTSANPSLEGEALARIDAGTSSLGLTQKTSVTISLTPEKGATFNLPLTLPAYSTKAGVDLVAIYP